MRVSTPSHMVGVCYRPQFLPQPRDYVSRFTRSVERQRRSPFAVRPTNCSQMQFTSSSHPEMVEPAKGTKAIAHTPWGVYATAWELEVGHSHPTAVTHSVADTVFDRSNCSSGVVRWCARHLQQLVPPWGTGVNAPIAQGWQDTALSPWGTTLTPP